MSNTIDNRVVQMGFDNKQFESGVKTTNDSLANLKKSLNLDESAKSLTNLSNAGKSFSMAGIGEGVQHISDRFSALGIIGFTVIQNLTNAAIDYGRKLIASITGPMKLGFQEFETQIGSIQTILANTESKGTTLDQVNAALDQLNEYSDKTIYNFTEMAKNIGTFTAAGVDLDTSVSAIKGIANLAAVSGSTSQQAATGMYQLSQAISSGTVKLMDWNSVTNAGMGGEVFKNALMDTARVHGIAIDDIIKREGSFRESLQTGWLSSTILTETLSKFTGDLTAEQLKTMGYTEEQIAGVMRLGEMANDAATKVKTFSQLKQTLQEALQSGWGQSWRLIIGDFEQSKRLFTEISDTLGGFIQASSDARNNFLKDWQEAGGRTYLIQSIRNAFEALLSILAPIKEAFRDIFPPASGKKLADLTFLLRELTEKLTLSSETADKLKRIFKGLFAGLDIVKEAVIALVESFFKLVSPLAIPAGNSILNFLAKIGDYLVGLRDSVKLNDSFRKGIEKIGTVLAALVVSMKTIGEKIVSIFEPIKESMGSAGIFNTITSNLKKFVTNLRNAFKSLKKIDVTAITSFIKEFTSRFTGFLTDLVELGSEVGRVLGGLGERIKARFGPLKDLVKDIAKIFDPIGDYISTALKKQFSKGAESASGIGELIGKFFQTIKDALGKIDFSKFSFDESFDGLNKLFTGGLLLTIMNFIKKGGSVFDGLNGMFGSVKGIADSAKGTVDKFSGIFDGVTGSLKAMQESLRSKVLLNIAIAIGILALSLALLSLIDSKKLTMALVAVTTLFTDLFAAMALYQKVSGTKGMIGMSGAVLSMVGVAVAMLILATTLKKLSDMDPNKLQVGVLALTGILASMVLFVKSFNNVRMNAGVGLAMIGVAIAIMLISKSIEKLGEMDPEDLKQALITIGAILAEVALFSRLTGTSSSLIASGAGLGILGVGLLVLVDVLSKMGNLKIDVVSQGLAALGASLAIIGVGMNLLPKDVLIKAIGLTIIAAALMILSKALSSMGKMSWDEIARGLVTLAGAMLIIVLGVTAMQGAIGGAIALIIIAGALTVLTGVLKVLGSMSLEEIGLALLAIAGVFLVLGLAGLILTPVVPTLLALGGAMLLIGVASLAFGAGVAALAVGLASLAVSGIAGATALVAMVGILLGIIPVVIVAIVGAIILFAKLIAEGAPVIGEALKTMLLTLIGVIIEVVPEFINGLMFLVGELLRTLAENIPEFIQSGMDILLGFLKGIRDNINDVVTTAVEIVTEFIDAVAEKLPDIIDSGFALIVAFIDGIAASIEENGPALNDAILRLADAIVKGLSDGLASGTKGVIKAISKLAGAAIDALKTLLGIFSPSTVTTELGEFTGLGFAKGLIRLGSKVHAAASGLVDEAVSGLGSTISRISEVFNKNLDTSPAIRPVIDLTGVLSGKDQIDGIFAKTGINITPTFNKALHASSTSGLLVDPSHQEAFAKANPSISLVQNNYSPEALSRLEIYRQTRNLLYTLKGIG